jgi:hypothetical protein
LASVFSPPKDLVSHLESALFHEDAQIAFITAPLFRRLMLGMTWNRYVFGGRFDH